MCCAAKRRSAGLRKRRWRPLTKRCCMSAAHGKSSAAPTRAVRPRLMKACRAALFSRAPSTRFLASGNPRICYRMVTTAWHCGPTVQALAGGGNNTPGTTSAVGVTICCATSTAASSTSAPLGIQRPIQSPPIPHRTRSGATAAASWPTVCSLRLLQPNCR